MIKKLFSTFTTLATAIYLVACGGGSSIPTNGSNNSSNHYKNISVEQALKNNHYLKIKYGPGAVFQVSSDGTKIFSISDERFTVHDITKVKMYNNDNERVQSNIISSLKIDLPDEGDDSVNTSKPLEILGSMAISKDEKTAYLASYDPRGGDMPGIGTLIILDISDIKNPKIITKDTKYLYSKDLKKISSIEVFPDGKHILVTTSRDTNSNSTDIHIIDVQDPKHPKIVAKLVKGRYNSDVINDITISDDGKRAYMATDNTIEVINLEDPTLPIRMQVIKRGYGNTKAIAITKNRKRMYVNSEKTLQVFDIEDDKKNLLTSFTIDGDGYYDEISNLVLSKDETRLYATCSDHNKEPDNSLVVFDITDKDKLKFKKKILAPSDTVFTYHANQKISPDGKKLYAKLVYFYIINLQKD
jgi:hypothetical protein